MAHFKVLIFIKDNSGCPRHPMMDSIDLSAIKGYIADGELFSYDLLCWMLPEMSEIKRRETFIKLLEKAMKEAEAHGLTTICADVDL
ncbi:MAG: hypothetical protein IKI64_06805 [Clostridia bacterium]|nr:hypothetical protein [Clostridia bacterium]